MHCEHKHTRSEQIKKLKFENQSLLNKVSILKLQLEQHDNEARRYKDQLKCLQLLVKRAWSGDAEALLHVANIVGIAPPDFEGDSGTYRFKTKSRALNNWAVLYTGLLKKLLKQQEDIYYLKKREYFTEREAFLDQQLKGYIRDEQQFTDRLKKDDGLSLFVKANEPYTDVSRKITSSSLLTSPKRPTGKRVSSGRCLSSGRSVGRIHSAHVHENTSLNLQESLLIEGRSSEELNTGHKSNSSLNKKCIRHHRSAITVSKSNSKKHDKVRPASAHPIQTMQRPRQYSSTRRNDETLRQLTVVEKDLRKTAAQLQRKLSLNPSGFLK